MLEHKFTVQGHILPLSEIPERAPESTGEAPATTLRPADLLDEGGSLASSSAVAGSLSSSALAASGAPTSTTASSTVSSASTETAGSAPLGPTSTSAPDATTTGSASPLQPTTALAALLPQEEQQQLGLLS